MKCFSKNISICQASVNSFWITKSIWCPSIVATTENEDFDQSLCIFKWILRILFIVFKYSKDTPLETHTTHKHFSCVCIFYSSHLAKQYKLTFKKITFEICVRGGYVYKCLYHGWEGRNVINFLFFPPFYSRAHKSLFS